MRTRAVVLVGVALLFAHAQTARPTQPRQLTLAERVAYQYVIEEVYWRHRIWPKENQGPKPSLDAVMSPTQIEKKVNDYLRNWQLLAEKWQRPITSEQLQAELERMARDTKRPEVLREIFDVLGNDPFVIAECLARLILTERLVAGLTAPRERGESPQRTEDAHNLAYTLPQISLPADCANDTWTTMSLTNAPTARANHSAVWTGSEMIVWGGSNQSGRFNTGGRYNPSTDSWDAIAVSAAITPREGHTAIWTGTEMIVWGGVDSSNNPLNTGGRYNPGNDTWTPTSATSAPGTRHNHTAVWTGSEMIVWGGRDSNLNDLDTGGRYEPSTDNWIPTRTDSAPSGREEHTVVWTGSEMIVWGGYRNGNYLNTGGKYNPANDTWTPTSTTDAPTARYRHSSIWTGSEMITWGGFGSVQGGGCCDWTNSGGRYNPGADSWMPTSTGSAPAAREFSKSVWTGAEMIVWGGFAASGVRNDGGRYYPVLNIWTPTTTMGAPTPRYYHSAVWTNSEMIVWGGTNSDASQYTNTGGKYCVQQPPPPIATSRKTHGFVGDFDIALPLTGTPGIESCSGGPTNDYKMVITFSGSVTVNGNPQAAVTAGTGAVGSEGKPNGGMVTVSGNVVTVPLTNMADAQTISVTLFSINGASNVAIPMSILVGDVNGNGAVNASDVALAKSRIGEPVSTANFRADVNASGAVNATDVSIVKSYIGTGLPTPTPIPTPTPSPTPSP